MRASVARKSSRYENLRNLLHAFLRLLLGPYLRECLKPRASSVLLLLTIYFGCWVSLLKSALEASSSGSVSFWRRLSRVLLIPFSKLALHCVDIDLMT